jgi:hypothetical protein
MQVVNTALLKNPLNWVIVLLMLLIASFAGHYLLQLAGIGPSKASPSTQ